MAQFLYKIVNNRIYFHELKNFRFMYLDRITIRRGNEYPPIRIQFWTKDKFSSPQYLNLNSTSDKIYLNVIDDSENFIVHRKECTIINPIEGTIEFYFEKNESLSLNPGTYHAYFELIISNLRAIVPEVGFIEFLVV